MIHSSCDDRIMRNVTKQRFPPAIVRFYNKQLQFHHIRGGGPRHKNESVHVIRAFLPVKNYLHLRHFLPSQMEAQFCDIQVAISRARPNYPSTGLYYRSIGTKHTKQIGTQTLFLLFSFPDTERKKKRDARRLSLGNARDESH